jgi:hypothetical protein
MKAFKKIASAAAAGLLLMAGAGAVQAATLDTTSAALNDGVLQNFTGIDWHANGAGWVQGFDLNNSSMAGATDTFTFTYQAFATSIASTSATPNLRVAPPGPATGGYELTTYAVLTETATCVNNGCTSINIVTNSGTFHIYFDATPDANQAAGSGFVDGVEIITGSFSEADSVSSFTRFPNGLGSGSAFLVGTVTATNNAYVNPNLLGTTLQASLQFPGQPAPLYTRPAFFQANATGADTATNFVVQTDTSQTFAVAVPEPASAFLFGIGFMGMAVYRRRKQG